MMSPGDVRTFQQGTGNAIVIGLGLWAEKGESKWIQIHMTGPNDLHTTVTNNPDSVRYHRTLFRDLRRTLIQQECWPYGAEGSETEEDTIAPSRFHPVPIRGNSLSSTILEDRGNV